LHAIEIFASNLRALLLQPRLSDKIILGIDPGYVSGCKIAVIDKTGKYLEGATIYPHEPKSRLTESKRITAAFIEKYKVDLIAIGNGTASRETEAMVADIIRDNKYKCHYLMVNEAGASVYSASEVAKKEFPDLDVTVRGAISIARRLQDPLAELVKIDPKSIGVGQYQHDVNQTALQKSLEDVVVSCVNSVGVDLYAASKELLTYVSGLGPVLAKNIIEARNKNGAFTSRDDLKKVPRFGEKAFEQAAGFLRIQNSENPLDASAVHPESYGIVTRMASSVGCNISELMANEELRKKIDLKIFITDKIGMPTLTDIMNELAKPGRDPRKKFDLFEFDKNVHEMKDLSEGMELPGIVTNITAFGAFVDIGVHQDGLVHISQMANRFISNPNEVVTLNQKVKVKVVQVDIERKRIQLSMKDVDQK